MCDHLKPQSVSRRMSRWYLQRETVLFPRSRPCCTAVSLQKPRADKLNTGTREKLCMTTFPQNSDRGWISTQNRPRYLLVSICGSRSLFSLSLTLCVFCVATRPWTTLPPLSDVCFHSELFFVSWGRRALTAAMISGHFCSISSVSFENRSSDRELGPYTCLTPSIN